MKFEAGRTTPGIDAKRELVVVEPIVREDSRRVEVQVAPGAVERRMIGVDRAGGRTVLNDEARCAPACGEAEQEVRVDLIVEPRAEAGHVAGDRSRAHASVPRPIGRAAVPRSPNSPGARARAGRRGSLALVGGEQRPGRRRVQCRACRVVTAGVLKSISASGC